MLLAKKKVLKDKVAKNISDFISANCKSDEEFFLTLLYFNQLITADLSRFDDVFDKESEE